MNGVEAKIIALDRLDGFFALRLTQLPKSRKHAMTHRRRSELLSKSFLFLLGMKSARPLQRSMHRVQFVTILILFLVGLCASQQHRVGISGPEAPPLQGAGQWHYRAPLPHARGGVAVAEAGGRVYVLGGYADGFVDQPLNEEYDPAANLWRIRAPMPRGLNHVGAVGLNGKVYCIGGFIEQNKSAEQDVSVYEPATNSWQELAPLPTPLSSVSVAILDGKIHAVGGRDRLSVGTHRVYDPATNRWSESAPLPQGRDHMGLVAIGGRLYAVGGRFNTFEYNTNLLDVYDPATNLWKSVKPMPTARSGMAVTVMDNKMFVFGGEKLGGTFNQGEVYDPAADIWAELTPMPMSVHGTGAVVVGDTIYIPAGATLNGGTAQTNGTQAFTLK